MNQNNFLCFVLKRPTKEASGIILNSRSNSLCINNTMCQSPSAEVITLLYRMALGVYGQGEPRWWRNAPAIYRRPELCYSVSGRS